MNIKKISFGIILLIAIYIGYQQYKNQQNIKLDSIENLENVKICSDGDCNTSGAICSDGTTCCSGNCNAGVCEPCYKLGGPCSSDGQCCASNCAYGFCGGTFDKDLDAAAGVATGTIVVGGGIYMALYWADIYNWLVLNGYDELAEFLDAQMTVQEANTEWTEDMDTIEEGDPELTSEIAADSTEVLADADEAVEEITPEAGEYLFAGEEAAGMGVGEEIAVDAAVVTGAAAE